MRKKYLLLALAIFGFGGVSDLYARFDSDFLNNIVVFQQGNGRTITVYEDISDIRFMPKSKPGANIQIYQESEIPEGYVLESDAKNWFNKMYPNAIYSDVYTDISSLIKAKFYLDFGHVGANGEWISRPIGSAIKESHQNFPHKYTETNNPRSQRYYYCFAGEDDNVKYVNNSVEGHAPDAFSCDDCEKFCPPQCKSLQETDSDEDDSEQKKPAKKYDHRRNLGKKLYSNFKKNVTQWADLKAIESITGNSSGIYAQINFRDRTPPWVSNTNNDKFPTLGEKNKNITTGDTCICDDIEITENRSKSCYVKISLGIIDDTPRSGENWTTQENWSEMDIEKLSLNADSSKGIFNPIITTPNFNYGYMRYTVFAEDIETTYNNGEDTIAGGNLNPGCATIVEDDPTNCYGLPNGGNLGTSINFMKAWPYSPNGEEEKRHLNINTITGKDRIDEGFIRITDNDLPNILIKLTSTKDGKSIFFPPCMPAGELIVRNSPDYYGVNGTNQQDYNAFVGSSIPSECDYNTVKSSRNKPYFKLLKLEASEWANSSDKSLMSSMLGDDYALINKTFRLEDHEHSDTTTNGDPETTNNDGEAGMRNGTWKNCVAFIDSTISPNIRIQEDVEYKLEIWTDDSVKWSNVTSSFPTTSPEDNRVIAIPTGIKSGEVTLNVPNQYPPIVDKALSFNQNKSINEFKVVFREPTDKVTINSEEDLINNKFPYVTIKACDHSGNERTIKLYFSVLDENTSIRTLQRKHDQH